MSLLRPGVVKHETHTVYCFTLLQDGPPKGRKRTSGESGLHGGKKVRVEIDMDLDSSHTGIVTFNTCIWVNFFIRKCV